MLPSLSCKNITFIEKGNNQVKTAKKWKKDVFKNLFYPNNISHKELLAMKTFEYQPNLVEVVEALGKEGLAAYGILSVNDN
uniref:Uncharacterized protein n=1 Tax=Panagrolaimus sp. PS1159 TaxID=55785 RepID=A0AC35FE82_9BILA